MLLAVVLFLLLQPGLLVTLPTTGKNIWMNHKTSVPAVFVHAIIYGVLLAALGGGREGFQTSGGGGIFGTISSIVNNALSPITSIVSKPKSEKCITLKLEINAVNDKIKSENLQLKNAKDKLKADTDSLNKSQDTLKTLQTQVTKMKGVVDTDTKEVSKVQDNLYILEANIKEEEMIVNTCKGARPGYYVCQYIVNVKKRYNDHLNAITKEKANYESAQKKLTADQSTLKAGNTMISQVTTYITMFNTNITDDNKVINDHMSILKSIDSYLQATTKAYETCMSQPDLPGGAGSGAMGPVGAGSGGAGSARRTV